MSEENNAVENVEVVDGNAEGSSAEAAKAPAVAKIIRGRMPLPLVWHVRFVASAVGEDTLDDDGEVVPGTYASDSAVAKEMFTTAGKIMDIRTNRNFKYLTENSTFSQADIDEAIGQLKKNIAEGKKRGTDEPSQDYSEGEAAPLFAILEGMVSEVSTIRDDRDSYNEANPRANTKKADDDAPTAVAEDEAEANATAEDDALTDSKASLGDDVEELDEYEV